MVVNDCYILQSRFGEDVYTENWIATAIYSATRFLLRFLTDNSNKELLDILRKDAVRCYHVTGPEIADFIEVDMYNNLLFISSEYHDEETLFSVMTRKNAWRIDQLCVFMLTLARSIHSFHSQNVIYGSLNEDAISSRVSGIKEHILKIQKPGMLALLPLLSEENKSFFRTYAYIPPEYKDNQQLCEGSDVYSLGILLVRFITGKYPFPDSLNAVKHNSPSLRFVANALLRRGICEDLVRITLRALFPDTNRRYTSSIDFITDLRYLMQKMQVPQPDVFIYSGSDTGIVKNHESVLYPLSPRKNANVVEQLEKKELVPLPKENTWSIDDYIDNGIRTVQQEMKEGFFLDQEEMEGNRHFTINKSVQELLGAFQNNSPVTVTDAHENVPAEEPQQGVKAPIKSRTRHEKVQDIQHLPIETSNRMVTSKVTRESCIDWSYARIRYNDVLKVLMHSVKRARKGTGSIRYIQEPVQGRLTMELFHSLEAFKDSCFYINLGTLTRYQKADITVFVMMLRNAIARELSGMSKKTRSYFVKKLQKLDTFGVFSSPPVGPILFNTNHKETSETILKTTEGQEGIMRALFAFARKDKPLVLVVRGGEAASRELNDLLNVLAARIVNVPAAVFVFFEQSDFPSWHVLSLLHKDNA